MKGEMQPLGLRRWFSSQHWHLEETTCPTMSAGQSNRHPHLESPQWRAPTAAFCDFSQHVIHLIMFPRPKQRGLLGKE